MMPTSDSTLTTACVDAAVAAAHGSVESARWLAFWTAAVLPIVYIPLALVLEIVHIDVWVFGELIALHVAALFFGHGYGRETTED